jgi:hypothetical protein
MKAIDELIEKYKKRIIEQRIFGLTKPERENNFFINGIIQDLEELKEQLNSNPIKEAFDNIPLENELRIAKLLVKDLAEENKQLKEQHKDGVNDFDLKTLMKENSNLPEGTETGYFFMENQVLFLMKEAVKHYQQTHEKK